MLSKLIILIFLCLLPSKALAEGSFCFGVISEKPQRNTIGIFLEADNSKWGGFISITGNTYTDNPEDNIYGMDIFSIGLIRKIGPFFMESHVGLERTIWREETVRIVRSGLVAHDDDGNFGGGWAQVHIDSWVKSYLILGIGNMIKLGNERGVCLYIKGNWNVHQKRVYFGVGIGIYSIPGE